MERSTEALYLCIDREVPMDLSLILASCFISLVGLPHGALDPVVAYRNGLINDWRSIIQFLVLYTGIVAAVVGLWILAPVLSLIALEIAHHQEDLDCFFMLAQERWVPWYNHHSKWH